MHELDDPQLLAQVVASLEDQLNVTGIRKIANGNEFFIFYAELASGPAIVKVPKDRVFSNVNDAHIDSRKLLDQEFVLMRHAKAHGITQVPEPISELEVAGFGAVVMSFVGSDESKPDQFRLGQILAKIHSVVPPELPLSAQEGKEIPELIATRLTKRWEELGSFENDLPELPAENILANILEPIRSTKQLLHMDFRQANFRMKDGEVIALLDWSNALVGHPALEMARVAETGENGEEFLRGYTSIKPLPVVAPIIETILRLDTATMLALVFLSEEPDPAVAPKFVKRAHELRRGITP